MFGQISFVRARIDPSNRFQLEMVRELRISSKVVGRLRLVNNMSEPSVCTMRQKDFD
ncbi:MAG: hypothetical protein MUD03_11430 [Pirellula sp.]|nr:hypothetical protein [Pirellula sp.]